MSSSKAKKERQLEKTQGGVDKRAAEAIEKQNAKKKTRRLAIIVIAIVVVLLAVAIVLNSKFLRREFTAVTVGDVEFSNAEYEFFYNNCYYEYYTYVYTGDMANYASMMLPQSGVPHASQEYDDGETWKDFFEEYTFNTLKRYVGLHKEGKAAGFELPKEDKENLKKEIENLSETAGLYGYTNVNQYLRDFFGSSATLEIVESCMEFITYATAYEEFYEDNIEYSEDEINAQYEEDKDLYDLFDYRYFLVKAETVDETQYETEEEITAAEEAALADARALAEDYLARIKTEEDFIAVAKEYDETQYAEEDSTYRSYNGELLGGAYGDWLREPERKTGDTTLSDVGNGTYVVYFIERGDNHYETVNARMLSIPYIPVDAEDYADEEDDTAYNAAVEAAIEEARVSAEDLLQQWKDEGGGEDLFVEYIEEYGESNGYVGGLYENIPRGKYGENISNWLYDPARQPGDTDVYYVEDAGEYVIIYYKGVGGVYSAVMAHEDLLADDLKVWDEKLVEGIEVSKTWLFALEKAGTQISRF